MHRIVQLAPDEFRFEYEDARQMPKLKKGQIFERRKKRYRIIHYHQVFGEQAYCSFLVIAKEVSSLVEDALDKDQKHDRK